MRRKFVLLFFAVFLYLELDFSGQVLANELDQKEVITYSFELNLGYGIQKVEIHGERRFIKFSQMVKQVITTSGVALFDYFEYVSSDTLHINLVEDATLANGSASVIPNTIINLNLMPALGTELLTADYNYIEGLVLHELTHILHLDQVRGVLKFVTAIFGNFGKWGIATPRWFIEGIGVWAETKFTQGGRLRNKMMTAMLYKNILDPNFCQSTSCFDLPGTFPDASYAYWMGGHFIDYLENKKSGTVRCLIESNSGQFPFFLNSSFHECTGIYAEDHYKRYRKNLVIKAKKFQKKIIKDVLFKKLVVVPRVLESTILSKNFHLLGSSLYRIEQSDDQEKIIGTNLLKMNSKIYKSSNNIEQILAPTSENISKNSLSLVGYPYLSMEVKRETTQISLRNNLETKLHDEGGAHYSFLLKNGESLSLRFDGLRWELKKEDLVLFTFPNFLNLYHPRLVGNHLYFQSFFEERSKKNIYSFERINILKPHVETEVLIKKNRPFSFIANDKRYFLFSYKNDFWLVDIKKNKRIIYSSKYTQNISALRFNDQFTVALFSKMPKNFYSFKGSIKSFLNYLKNKKSRVKTQKVLIKRSSRFEHALKNVEQEKIGTYPRLKHFTPHTWLFSFATSTNQLSSFNAQTVLADPRGHHVLSLAENYYYDISKFAPDLTYQYGPKDFTLFSAYKKDFSISSFTSVNNEEEIILLGTGYKFDDRRINFYPKVYYAVEIKDDFISHREIKSFNLSLLTNIQKVNRDDFFQSFSSDILFSKRSQQNIKDHDQIDLTFNSNFRLSFNLGLIFEGTYAFLNKKRFSSGVIFAGGANERHSFYGLSSSDAYGNEIITARAELNYSLFRAYFGWGFMPLYFKEFHLILGEEVLKADRFSFKSQLFSNEKLLSTYIGLRSKMNVFYHVPISLDLILSKVSVPTGGQGGYNFSVRVLANSF